MSNPSPLRNTTDDKERDMKYIVCSDLTDDAVKSAADALLSKYPDAVVVDLSQAAAWPGATPGETLYLVGHGNGVAFEGYKDPSELFREHPNVKDVFDSSRNVVLVSCATASEAQTILDNGFQAGTFAKNLSSVDAAKSVHAAVGPVYADGFGALQVETPSGAEGIASNDGWVTFEGGRQDMNATSPFE